MANFAGLTKTYLKNSLLIGGVINNNIGRKTNFYDPDTDTFNDGPDMNTNRYAFGAVLLNPCPLFNGRPAVLSVGGHSKNSAELLDYTTNGATWQYSKYTYSKTFTENWVGKQSFFASILTTA